MSEREFPNVMAWKPHHIGPFDIAEIDPFVWAARFGYAVRGVVFLIVGGLALFAARDSSVRPRGIRDFMRHVVEQPLGSLLLWIVACGLLCFAVWRFLQASLDTEGFGRDLNGLIRRAILAYSSLFYLVLALTSGDIAMGTIRKSENRLLYEWTGWLLVQPLGRVALVLIGAGFVAVAVGLVVQAALATYRHRLMTGPVLRMLAVMLGSFGILTRAVIFLLFGVFLEFAAYHLNARDVIGLTGILRLMQTQSRGWQLGVIALGLLSFGLFEIIQAHARDLHMPKFSAKHQKSESGLLR